MNLQKAVAGTLIALGLILALLFAAPLKPDWFAFGVAAGVLAIGMIWLRRLTKREQQLEETAGGSKSNLHTLLEKAIQQVQILLANCASESALDKKGFQNQLTEVQVSYFVPVSESRDRFIERYGVKRYADIMIPFAMAERYFNRSVSAAMDGYWSECLQSLQECQPFLKEALEQAK